MADPKAEAGTPDPKTAGSENAGTAAQGGDGSEQAGGKPVDPALAMAWKEKAERVNAAEQRARDLEARLAELDRQQYAQANPIQDLMQRAAWDPEAQAQLQSMTLNALAVQQAENNLTAAMVRNGVKPDLWDTVAGLVRQSGYRMDVPSALELARGREAPVLQEQLKARDERIRQLEEALKGQAANGTPKVSLSTPAAAGVDPNEEIWMTPEEYAASKEDLRNKNVKFKR